MEWKIFSVFISSTFGDMHSERDYLKRFVFPELNEDLKKYGVILRVIDLRWGIDTLTQSQENIEEKVMRVCFDEIDRSRPFFIALLGNRYGWIPPVSSNKQLIKKRLPSGGSITSMEIEYGILQQKDIFGCLIMERDASCLNAINEEVRGKYDDAFAVDKTHRDIYPQRLENLKNKIKNFLHEKGKDDCYQMYCPTWTGEGFENLHDFGIKVKQIMFKEISSVFPLEDKHVPFQDEEQRQKEFLFMKTAKLYNRVSVTHEVLDIIKNKTGLLIISGCSGSGKSCIYAYLVKHLQELSNQYIVLYHTTAMGTGSRDAFQMIKRWNLHLETTLRFAHTETETINDTISYFKHLIKRIPKGKKLLLFIDAIDGFLKNTITDYLSFYPRSILPQCLMICTSVPEKTKRVSQYHRSMEEYLLPPLDKKEALAIMTEFTAFHGKEIYPDLVNGIMKCQYQDTPCYTSPLWLRIALGHLLEFNETDFKQISLRHEDFNQGFVSYVNELIADFSKKDNDLFKDLLLKMKKFYGDMPLTLFKLLSISYNGLDEDTIATIMGKEWNSLRFASVRNYLCDFIAEQGLQKSWQIMHESCKQQLSNDETVQISRSIASYYIQKIYMQDVVNDNIIHYLIKAEDNDLSLKYFRLFHRYKKRIINEILQVCEIVDSTVIFDYLFKIYVILMRQSWWITKTMRLYELKEIVVTICRQFNKLGKNIEVIAFIDSFYELLQNCNIKKDYKSVLFILTEPERERAAESVCSKEEEKKAYQSAIKRVTISGPLSLLMVPLAKKYYKWQIFKLSNDYVYNKTSST